VIFAQQSIHKETSQVVEKTDEESHRVMEGKEGFGHEVHSTITDFESTACFFTSNSSVFFHPRVTSENLQSQSVFALFKHFERQTPEQLFHSLPFKRHRKQQIPILS
jgi:hypothetical protein